MTPRTPRSTYRLQLTAEFDLFEAARRLPYLHDLGVDWVYLSPVLAAEPGSQHGYDVAVHTREDPERGGATGSCVAEQHPLRPVLGLHPTPRQRGRHVPRSGEPDPHALEPSARTAAPGTSQSARRAILRTG